MKKTANHEALLPEEEAAVVHQTLDGSPSAVVPAGEIKVPVPTFPGPQSCPFRRAQKPDQCLQGPIINTSEVKINQH